MGNLGQNHPTAAAVLSAQDGYSYCTNRNHVRRCTSHLYSCEVAVAYPLPQQQIWSHFVLYALAEQSSQPRKAAQARYWYISTKLG